MNMQNVLRDFDYMHRLTEFCWHYTLLAIFKAQNLSEFSRKKHTDFAMLRVASLVACAWAQQGGVHVEESRAMNITQCSSQKFDLIVEVSMECQQVIANAFLTYASDLCKEYHPKMPLWTCDSSGCSKEMKTVVLDANWRWMHNGEYTNCYKDGDFDSTLCSTPLACAENCHLEGWGKNLPGCLAVSACLQGRWLMVSSGGKAFEQ